MERRTLQDFCDFRFTRRVIWQLNLFLPRSGRTKYYLCSKRRTSCLSTIFASNFLFPQLEKKGLLKRTHGGAITCPKAGFEPTSSEKIRTRAEQKQAIAQYALSLIENGDTIALDTGTTTYCLAELLSAKQNITVITTDTKIAALLEAHPGISVIIAGGALRKGFSCTTGAITNSILAMFNVDKVFIAANAVTTSGNI